MRSIAKTATYWVLHISVASSLAFALTGDLNAALAIGLLEPSVQAVVFFLHERAWERVPALPAPKRFNWKGDRHVSTP
jgi:uncharacterized membrane protein